MDKRTKGAWIIHHAQKMLGAQNCTSFECIEKSGSCGIVLATLSTSNKSLLDYGLAKQLSVSNGIQKLAFDGVINILKNKNLIDIDKNKTKIELLGLTRESVLLHTSQLYESFEPELENEIVITVAEAASHRPRYKNNVAELLSDKRKVKKEIVVDILTRAAEIGFIDTESADGKTLLFNGNLFRREYSKKISKVLDSLGSQEQRKVQELDAILSSTACVTSDEAILIIGVKLLQKLASIGLYDLSKVSNVHENVIYVSRPSAYSKFGSANDDPLDESKALVAALSYGMSKSSPGRGRINYLSALMGKLISGNEVGPATAIGEDYQILERMRVLQVRPEGNRFMMKLLKKDVGDLALKAIETGDISTHSLAALRGAKVSQFAGPERQRVLFRKTLTLTQRETIETLKALRA